MSSWKWKAAVVVGGWLATCSLLGQGSSTSQSSSDSQSSATQAPGTRPSTPQRDQAPDKPAQNPDAAPNAGKVLFSRSDDDASTETKATDGKTNTNAAGSKPATQPGVIEAAAAKATAVERKSLTFVAYDLDVRLVPRQESLAVRARMTVRNDGDKPLKRIALQLSSALKWEQIRAAGVNVIFTQHPVDSDADHTGAVNEAVVTLARELAPKEELKLDTLYSGQLALSAERLERIGAPTLAAEKSDWDRVSADFTGLRGFGNVVWYPVSAPPVLLGNGAQLFTEIGEQKLRGQQTRVTMSVTSEYSADASAPNLAVLDGQIVPVVPTAAPENSYPGVVSATLPETVLGFATPSLFLLSPDKKIESDGVRVFAATEDVSSAQDYIAAANQVTPLMQRWLGPKSKSALTIIGLPDAGNAAWETGAVFFTGFKASPNPKELEDAMAHSLAHAYFHSPRVWLDEGVAQFMGSLWIEQTLGRQAALEALESERGALSLAEPGTPGETGGEDLIQASDAIYYRTKAVYVFWMLRDLAGDTALAAALRAYIPENDTTPDYFEQLLEKASGKDLRWFFDAWVYHDRGLPDLSITGVFPSQAAQGGQWLVAVDLANDGYADVEVPVTVRAKDATMTERLRVPARGTVTRRMLFGAFPTEVQVNDGTLPESADSIHVRKLTVDAK